ncbi:MAG: RNA 2',3'-cyclic phosphodiesterase [Proteobacteria bacterium]|nr:RNA 2',3'-cyclic phosphodiesterase [Pseudomonadota bacterium]
MPRLFVGLELPHAVRSDLARLSGGIPGGRWLAPEQFHLTLRFIGEVDGARFEEIALALADVEAERFTLALDGLGYFAQGRKPHTLWAGVRPAPALIALHERVASRLRAVGLAPERRNFSPHVTIARLRRVTPARLADYLQGFGAFASAPFEITAFALYSSFLSHNGAIYTVEASYPLRDALPASAAVS